jgi:hypothetical protein
MHVQNNWIPLFLSPTLSLTHTHTHKHTYMLSPSLLLALALPCSLSRPPARTPPLSLTLSLSLSLSLIRFRPVYMALRVVRGLAALKCQLIATMDQVATTPRVVAIN